MSAVLLDIRCRAAIVTLFCVTLVVSNSVEEFLQADSPLGLGVRLAPRTSRLRQRLVHASRGEHGAEPNQGLFLVASMKHAQLTDISARVIAHHTLASDDLYKSYRDNWVATLRHLGERLGPLLDPEVLQSAIRELKRVSGDELLVETIFGSI